MTKPDTNAALLDAEAIMADTRRRDPIARCVVIESRLAAIEARLQHLEALAGIPTAGGHL